jgi:CxxC motif-containing protein (DUF1111 family)
MASVGDRSSHAFMNPIDGLTADQEEDFLAGKSDFRDVFVFDTSSINSGLGPQYNNNSCVACHVNNGRGLTETSDGAIGSQVLVRVSMPGEAATAPGDYYEPGLVCGEEVTVVAGGAAPLGNYGHQLQDHAVPGETPQAIIELRFEEVPGTYADGTPYILHKPAHVITLQGDVVDETKMATSFRTTQPVVGMGLLEAISEEAICAIADPDDEDGDGISGRPNRVWNIDTLAPQIGRFGWKASQPTAIQQSAAAYENDMGVTNPLTNQEDAVYDIEEEVLELATFYVLALDVPAQERADDPVVEEGEALFLSAGCEDCHTQTFTTGEHEIEALRNRTIHPYTDMLLHNMGEDLADGRPDYDATGREWRTPPLWGLGLVDKVLGGRAGYLHDGRAQSVEEAIIWHGGEAKTSRDAFLEMSADQRSSMLEFLSSL